MTTHSHYEPEIMEISEGIDDFHNHLNENSHWMFILSISIMGLKEYPYIQALAWVLMCFFYFYDIIGGRFRSPHSKVHFDGWDRSIRSVIRELENEIKSNIKNREEREYLLKKLQINCRKKITLKAIFVNKKNIRFLSAYTFFSICLLANVADFFSKNYI